MNAFNIEAIYEQGTLKLPQTLPLQDGQKVTITIHATCPNVQRRRGLIEWKCSLEDLDYLIRSEDNDVLEAP
jgi:predicted DNA-binding antitoxin AbrB/MazE fold protein